MEKMLLETLTLHDTKHLLKCPLARHEPQGSVCS